MSTPGLYGLVEVGIVTANHDAQEIGDGTFEEGGAMPEVAADGEIAIARWENEGGLVQDPPLEER